MFFLGSASKKRVAALSRLTHTNGNTPTASYAPTVAAGSGPCLLLVSHNGGQSTYTTATAGWRKVAQQSSSDNSASIGIFVGDVGASAPTISLSTSQYAVGISWRFSGWSGLDIDLAYAWSTGSSATPDPPSLTPSWGAAEDFWVVANALSYERIATTAPSGYGNFQAVSRTAAGSSFSGSAMSAADRTLAAATEDPGAFTGAATSQSWLALSMALRPS